jgi:hypothetical protein
MQRWLTNIFILPQQPKGPTTPITIKDFLKDIKKLKDRYNEVFLSISYVRYPNFLEASLLPDSWRHYLEESMLYLENFNNEETIKRFSHVLAFFDSKTHDNKIKKDLVIFLEEYDRRRSKKFTDTFPEYLPILDSFRKLD